MQGYGAFLFFVFCFWLSYLTRLRLPGALDRIGLSRSMGYIYFFSICCLEGIMIECGKVMNGYGGDTEIRRVLEGGDLS